MYEEEAKALGLSLTDRPHKEKDFLLTSKPGDYRYFIHKPEELEFELLTYTNPDEDLVITELEVIEGKEGITPSTISPQGIFPLFSFPLKQPRMVEGSSLPLNKN